MMQYLLLWSGEMYAMRKATIPAIENKTGICGHWRDGKLFVPCESSIANALPLRYQDMFQRAGNFWYDKSRNDAPATIHLCDTRGKYRHTLYLQPLDKESNQ